MCRGILKSYQLSQIVLTMQFSELSSRVVGISLINRNKCINTNILWLFFVFFPQTNQLHKSVCSWAVWFSIVIVQVGKLGNESECWKVWRGIEEDKTWECVVWYWNGIGEIAQKREDGRSLTGSWSKTR